jgi:hypothetical protein
MLVTYRNGGVGLAIVHERGEQGWQSFMREGNGDSVKLISNGSMSSYSESDERSNVATLQKEALVFNYLFFCNFFFMPTSSPSKN